MIRHISEFSFAEKLEIMNLFSNLSKSSAVYGWQDGRGKEYKIVIRPIRMAESDNFYSELTAKTLSDVKQMPLAQVTLKKVVDQWKQFLSYINMIKDLKKSSYIKFCIDHNNYMLN